MVDPDLALPPTARLFSIDAGPVIVAASEDRLDADDVARTALADRGVTLLPLPTIEGRRPHAAALRHLLESLARDHDVATVMTEAGPGLLGALFDADLVDAALVFTAPHRFESPTTKRPPRDRLDPACFDLVWRGDRDGDQVRWWQRR